MADENARRPTVDRRWEVRAFALLAAALAYPHTASSEAKYATGTGFIRLAQEFEDYIVPPSSLERAREAAAAGSPQGASGP